MTMTRVNRLHLTLSEAAAEPRARFFVEEALRLSGQDGGDRLIILRRVNLGAIDQGINSRTVDVLRDMISRAVAADSPESHRAEAVYFESAEGARATLLEKLLFGLEPLAWFWPKAVPEWRRGDVKTVLRMILQLQSSAAGRIRFGRVLLRVVDAGSLSILRRWIESPEASMLNAAWRGHHFSAPMRQHAEVAVVNRLLVTQELNAAKRLLVQQVPGLQRTLNRLASSLPQGDVVRNWLLASIMPALMPHLADDTAFCTALGLAAEDLLVSEKWIEIWKQADVRPNMTRSAVYGRNALSQGNSEPAEGRKDASHLPSVIHAEQRTVAAGLFYLVRPLRCLGYDSWLKANPGQASLLHGVHLLRHIALRLRIAPDDPVWGLLPQEDVPGLSLVAWRVGLNRWLRKHCRVGLTKVVRRVGWIEARQDQMLVRFPLHGADVRMRRAGVDIDPGFVPWLGCSLSYIYEDKC